VKSEATRAALEDIIDAFQCGDHERLAARFDDDIAWLLNAPVSIFPFAGARRGKIEVLTSLALVYQSYSISRYDVPVILADRDRAATIADVHVVQRTTGRVIRSRLGNFYRFRDGKVIEYCGFTDSFDSAEQVLGYELDV